MKKLSPIKKFILGIAAVAVVISLITANNLASVMLIVASREAGSTQTVQTGGNASTGSSSTGGSSIGSSSTGSSSTGSPSTGSPSTVTPSTGSSSTGSDVSGSTDTGSDKGTSTDAPSTDKTDAPAGDSSDDKKEDEKPSDSPADSKEMSTAEIVDLYKKAVNNAKANAKTVTRVKDGALNYNGVAEAGALSGAASTLMGMFMVADEASIEVKNEPFTNNDIPPANSNSNLTVAGVEKAECKEEGDYYIVTIVAKNATNPTAGSDGVGSVSSVIEESQITGSISSVPGLSLSNINIAYENVTAVAKIEKSTGNLVNIKTDAPCYLSLDAKLLMASIEGAKVGIEVISEFAMTY